MSLLSAEDPYLSVREASRLTSLSTRTLYARCAEGKIPHVRDGDRICIRLSVLDRYMRLQEISIEDIDRLIDDAVKQITGKL